MNSPLGKPNPAPQAPIAEQLASASNAASPAVGPRDFAPPVAGESRRSFFKQISTAAAGGVLLQSGLPAVHAAVDETIRVGLIGCGGRGRGAAVNAMNADYNVRIVGLADLYPQAIATCRRSLAKNNEKQFTVEDDQCFTGIDAYRQLLATDIDVVLLAAPPHFRPAHLAAAVDAGKQIFCEKPVAVDPAGVRDVMASCQRAEAAGLNLVSGLCWRYHTGMIEGINRVLDGAVGDIRITQANYLASPVWMKTREPGESDMEYQLRNWYNYIWLSGDHYVEQFIHSLDKALWLHRDEPPVRAYGMGGRQNRDDETQGNIYDHFAVVYEWADGSRTFANTRQMSDCFTETEDYVFGSKGTAKLIAGEITGENPWKFEGDVIQMHQAEQNEMFAAIRGERPRINNGDYMCKSTMMSILGREVCYSGKILTYEQVANSPLNLSPPDYAASTQPPPVIVPEPGNYTFPLA